jgi:hypothetical protein
MKKVYLAPRTEAMELIASTVLMASPGGGFKNPNIDMGAGSYDGVGQ